MKLKIALSLCFAFLIHLQTTAGELIKVTGIEELNPIISVQLSKEDQHTVTTNVAKEGAKILALYLVQNGRRANIAVAGHYKLNNNELAYTTYSGIGYDQSYEVVYIANGEEHTKRFVSPPHPTSKVTAKVITTYPLADTIPYNTLYFHVRFSEPMLADQHAYQYIKVFDEQGNERQRAWRQRSFWLDNGKLLVLMIHPGRVKNGIHFESPLFDSGKRYTIEVSKDIKDINGNPVAASYSQSYYVKGEDRQTPMVSLEHNSYSIAKTKKAISITFSEGMDHASVIEGTKVYNRAGKEIPCDISNTIDSKYIITPKLAWDGGAYTVEVGGSVYDYAANRLNRPFEITDVNDIEKDKIKTKLSFTIQ